MKIMCYKMLRPFIVKVSVLDYFPLSKDFYICLQIYFGITIRYLYSLIVEG